MTVKKKVDKMLSHFVTPPTNLFFVLQCRQLCGFFCLEPAFHHQFVLHLLDEGPGGGDIVRIGVRGRQLPALGALWSAMRIIRTGIFTLLEHNRIDLAPAAECAQDLAAFAQLIAGPGKGGNRMFTGR